MLPFHEARHLGQWNMRSDRSVIINTRRQPTGRRAASAGIIGFNEISAIKIASKDKPSSFARVRREYSLHAPSYKPVCILKMVAQRLRREHLAMSSEVWLHPILGDLAESWQHVGHGSDSFPTSPSDPISQSFGIREPWL